MLVGGRARAGAETLPPPPPAADAAVEARARLLRLRSPPLCTTRHVICGGGRCACPACETTTPQSLDQGRNTASRPCHSDCQWPPGARRRRRRSRTCSLLLQYYPAERIIDHRTSEQSCGLMVEITGVNASYQAATAHETRHLTAPLAVVLMSCSDFRNKGQCRRTRTRDDRNVWRGDSRQPPYQRYRYKSLLAIHTQGGKDNSLKQQPRAGGGARGPLADEPAGYDRLLVRYRPLGLTEGREQPRTTTCRRRV